MRLHVMPLRRVAIASALALGAAALHAQPAGLAFEVGTVKVSQPGSGPFSVVTFVPGVRDGVLTARSVSLRRLVAYAYDVSQVQVSGPGWLDKNLYDIAAKVPEGAQPGEIRPMLRAFLAERFHLATHAATEEMDALALVEHADGIKLYPLDQPDPYRPKVPDGASIIMVRGDMRSWAETITRVIGSPVLDRTGIQGHYGGVIAYSAPDRATPGDFPSFPTALKEQAGLELVKRKMDVEMVVVDSANQVPEEN